MINKGHHIDEYLSAELKNAEITPPEGVWEAIENKLNKKQKVRILWYKAGLAAGIALIAAISGTLYILNTTDNNRQITSNTGVPNKTASVSTNNNAPQTNIQANTNNTSGTTHSTYRQTTKNTQSKQETTELPDYNKPLNESQSISETNNNYLNAYIAHKVENNNPSNINLAYQSINDNNETYTKYIVSSVDEENSETENFKPTVQRWSIDCEFAPTYAYRSIKNIADNAAPTSTFNNNETGLLAWSGGIKTGYKLSKKINIQLGLYYSVMGQQITNLYTVKNNTNLYGFATDQLNQPKNLNQISDNINISNSLGTITSTNQQQEYLNVPNVNNRGTSNQISNNQYNMMPNYMNSSITYSKIDGKIIQKLHYIDIPAIIRYNIYNGKIKCHILGGLNTEILVKTSARLKTSDTNEELGQNLNIKPVNLSSMVGLGFQYPLRPKVNFIFEPTFKYNINSVTKNTERSVHLYSYNLYTGFSFEL